MNGANFFLVMNLLIGLSFCVVFLIVSTRSRSASAARWIASAYAIASLSTVAELLVAYTDWPMFFALMAFSTVLGGMVLIRIGIGKLYGVPANPWFLGIFFLASVFLDLVIYDLPRGTFMHSVSYQVPFALIMVHSAVAIVRSSRRMLIDRVMLVLLILAGLQFMAKGVLAVLVGAGQTAKDYVHSYYALVSQSTTGVFVVIIGLMLLSVFVLEIMADERTNSEVDSLSGVYNRRGFDTHCDLALRRRSSGPHSLILCDLDHFKKVNDTYGHFSGDSVIRHFGGLLRASVPDDAVVGRIGGEEFCILLPGVPLDAAVMFAQALRGSVAMQTVQGLPTGFHITASFGLAAFQHAHELSMVMRHADKALYDAKAAGRNCVRQYRAAPAFSVVPNSSSSCT
ncbi:GGDEF domain-containing protein [Rhizobium sp. CSW-27]|uniref:GGDEF domain-containing protein n=1 Tax=Rhizobium sp. CSW-27 TaxID=2839985 RepID=UPI001C02124B|nr:GGDEF domain-containing protein [Rhizobium sp. CSW-27]MBT9372355.1 GGDEF domain-containing protein [Rhizobium sp. CSW-27]